MPRARNAGAAGLSAAGRGLDEHEKSIQNEIRDLERQLQAKKSELNETVRVHREISALGGTPRVAVAARRASAGRAASTNGRRRQAQPATRGRRRQAQPVARRKSAGRPTAARSTDDRVAQIRGVLSKGPMTASEIATATSMSQQRARQLMAFMIEKKLVSSSEQSSGRGRPKLVFALTGRGSSAGRKPAAAASARGGAKKAAAASASTNGRRRGAGRKSTSTARARGGAKKAAAASASTNGRRRGAGRGPKKAASSRAKAGTARKRQAKPAAAAPAAAATPAA